LNEGLGPSVAEGTARCAARRRSAPAGACSHNAPPPAAWGAKRPTPPPTTTPALRGSAGPASRRRPAPERKQLLCNSAMAVERLAVDNEPLREPMSAGLL